MTKYLILIALLITHSSLACNPVLHLNKGDAAPCDGFIFSVDEELKNRAKLMELQTDQITLENNAKIIALLKTENIITNDQVKLWQTQSSDLAKQLVDKDNASFWKSLGYFSLGAALTTIIVFGVNKASK